MDRSFASVVGLFTEWEAQMLAQPCLACGTTGGYLPRKNRTPSRERGLCVRCYVRHTRQGTLEQFARTNNPGRIPQQQPQPVPARVVLVDAEPLPWGAPSNPEWHGSIARDAARTWATAEWVGREQAA